MPDPTEEWRLIPEWPSYEVSSIGRVRRSVPAYSYNPKTGARVMTFPAGRLLKPAPNTHGYFHVELMRDGKHKTVYVASLVCSIFNGPRPTPEHEAAHNDGVPANNAATNVRWATTSENQADRVAHGTHARGERSPNATLTNAQVIVIKSAFSAGATCRQIATQFPITYQNAWQIKSGKRWAHIHA